MSSLTRQPYFISLSNVGSFGKGLYLFPWRRIMGCIGVMTCRLTDSRMPKEKSGNVTSRRRPSATTPLTQPIVSTGISITQNAKQGQRIRSKGLLVLIMLEWPGQQYSWLSPWKDGQKLCTMSRMPILSGIGSTSFFWLWSVFSPSFILTAMKMTITVIWFVIHCTISGILSSDQQLIIRFVSLSVWHPPRNPSS